MANGGHKRIRRPTYEEEAWLSLPKMRQEVL